MQWEYICGNHNKVQWSGESGLETGACGSWVKGGLENGDLELEHVAHGSWEAWRIGTGN